ncbi:MAG: LysM domain-containing protein, partial [Verrucomicrobiaceae bacterium]
MKSSASEITGTLRRLSARIWNPASARDHGHRLPASLARQQEEDWDPDQPQIRMSRAFAVMLVLHLVAVGGLFAFHVFGKDDQNAEQQATRQANASAVPPPVRPVAANDSTHPAASSPAGLAAAVAAGAAAPRAEEVSEDTPVDGSGNPYQVHVMLPGESKVLVAARYGITMKELEAANPGTEFRAGTHLTIPQAGQRVITATPGAELRPGIGGLQLLHRDAVSGGDQHLALAR